MAGGIQSASTLYNVNDQHNNNNIDVNSVACAMCNEFPLKMLTGNTVSVIMKIMTQNNNNGQFNEIMNTPRMISRHIISLSPQQQSVWRPLIECTISWHSTFYFCANASNKIYECHRKIIFNCHFTVSAACRPFASRCP